MGRWTGLDRVIAVEPGRGARALQNVPHTLDIFDSHFPRFPVLPGVLILGSMGELASLLLKQEAGSGAPHPQAGTRREPGQAGRPWRLAEAAQVRFRHFVQPGDQLDVAVELTEWTPEAATFSGTVKVDGKTVATARRLRLVPDGPDTRGAGQ